MNEQLKERLEKLADKLATETPACRDKNCTACKSIRVLRAVAELAEAAREHTDLYYTKGKTLTHCHICNVIVTNGSGHMAHCTLKPILDALTKLDEIMK